MSPALSPCAPRGWDGPVGKEQRGRRAVCPWPEPASGTHRRRERGQREGTAQGRGPEGGLQLPRLPRGRVAVRAAVLCVVKMPARAGVCVPFWLETNADEPGPSAQAEADLPIQKYLHGPGYARAGARSTRNRSLCQAHRVLAQLEEPGCRASHQPRTAECEL